MLLAIGVASARDHRPAELDYIAGAQLGLLGLRAVQKHAVEAFVIVQHPVRRLVHDGSVLAEITLGGRPRIRMLTLVAAAFSAYFLMTTWSRSC